MVWQARSGVWRPREGHCTKRELWVVGIPSDRAEDGDEAPDVPVALRRRTLQHSSSDLFEDLRGGHGSDGGLNTWIELHDIRPYDGGA